MDNELRERILDNALQLAESRHWQGVRMRRIAENLGLTLDVVRAQYPDKEALVEAWFERADRAMLREASRAEFGRLPMRERLFRATMAWLDALAPHRQVTGEMVRPGLSPAGAVRPFGTLARLSRTVRWIREAAEPDRGTLGAAVEQSALTSIVAATFACWLTDASQGSARTRRFLDRLLGGADRLVRGMGWPQEDRPGQTEPGGVAPPPADLGKPDAGTRGKV